MSLFGYSVIRHRRPRGDIAGYLFTGRKYSLYVTWTTGWVGQYAYPKGSPRLIWRPTGGLMLRTTRIEWYLTHVILMTRRPRSE